ncbi:MAG TPA: two pore domain potassium channel family protein [Methylophaga aminisulfidivorans]|uniref:Ion transporter n=1 Tax=Methylophaga thalassica TaxID=40223 RepID=A0ABQ5TZL7_9GAMM|nr:MULTISPECIES: potassium channel family protein [Methylophaga]GLP99980.1 ion transporter [Methylophaga thalassica]HIC46777.1 two pore domain potassium channel family protein [Methylophaga sp.]HIM39498.1 two pore domain potassium channel family protein [Methylophaga aminisulfidivorans]
MLLTTFVINTFVFVSTILIHYETLYQLAKRLPALHIIHRYRVLLAVMVVMVAHIVEIWLFAIAYYLMIQVDGFGTLMGNIDSSLLDCSYFSFTTYTTLGFGDIEPTGYVRFLTGLESLTGLVMITWSASFVFLEMQKYWPKR